MTVQDKLLWSKSGENTRIETLAGLTEEERQEFLSDVYDLPYLSEFKQVYYREDSRASTKATSNRSVRRKP